MAITASNYAAQAEKALRKLATLKLGTVTQKQLADAAKKIRSAVHFAVPDGGKILEAGFKSIRRKELRLPYPLLTLEACFPEASGKVVVTAQEVPISQARSLFQFDLVDFQEDSGDYVFAVTVVVFRDGSWVPTPCMLLIPSRWDTEDKPGSFRYLFVEYLEEWFKAAKNAEPNKDFTDWEKGSVTAGGAILLEFLEALACINVGEEILEPPKRHKGKQRKRKGKAPIYETRVLVLKTPESRKKRVATAEPKGGTPKRMHLRRGHIKRKRYGNVWCNACVVGKSKNGVVDKSYQVERSH